MKSEITKIIDVLKEDYFLAFIMISGLIYIMVICLFTLFYLVKGLFK
ncbi:hypothetical protein [Gracilibacillus sp. JCM 18860]